MDKIFLSKKNRDNLIKTLSDNMQIFGQSPRDLQMQFVRILMNTMDQQFKQLPQHLINNNNVRQYLLSFNRRVLQVTTNNIGTMMKQQQEKVQLLQQSRQKNNLDGFFQGITNNSGIQNPQEYARMRRGTNDNNDNNDINRRLQMIQEERQGMQRQQQFDAPQGEAAAAIFSLDYERKRGSENFRQPQQQSQHSNQQYSNQQPQMQQKIGKCSGTIRGDGS